MVNDDVVQSLLLDTLHIPLFEAVHIHNVSLVSCVNDE